MRLVQVILRTPYMGTLIECGDVGSFVRMVRSAPTDEFAIKTLVYLCDQIPIDHDPCAPAETKP